MHMTDYPLLVGKAMGEAIQRWDQAESLGVYGAIGRMKGAPNGLD